MCRVLGVSRSGYYAWRARRAGPPGRRAANDLAVLDQIRQVHARRPCYGSPRVHRELRARQVRVGRHRVARLMRQHAIVARWGRIKRPRSVPPQRRPEITDQVRRHVSAPAPDRLWCTDITMIRTQQGWLYAAVILDAFSRKVISWSVNDREDPRPHCGRWVRPS
jgi:putative transposase